MSTRRPKRSKSAEAPKALSRRRFVGLLAAGSAAVLARPAEAAATTTPTASAEQKEFERQRANTLGALKTIRAYPLPPGGDLAVVFRPLPSVRRSR